MPPACFPSTPHTAPLQVILSLASQTSASLKLETKTFLVIPNLTGPLQVLGLKVVRETSLLSWFLSYLDSRVWYEKVIFRQLQTNKLSFWWYIYGKERLLLNILPKSQNRYLTPPTSIFRSSSKQPEGTSDSFRGGRSQYVFVENV